MDATTSPTAGGVVRWAAGVSAFVAGGWVGVATLDDFAFVRREPWAVVVLVACHVGVALLLEAPTSRRVAVATLVMIPSMTCSLGMLAGAGLMMGRVGDVWLDFITAEHVFVAWARVAAAADGLIPALMIGSVLWQGWRCERAVAPS
jgi:hypothetical protein